MLEKVFNVISRFVTALARVGYDPEKLRLLHDAPSLGPSDVARLRRDARLPGLRNAALRVFANLLRLCILIGLPIVLVLLLSLLLAGPERVPAETIRAEMKPVSVSSPDPARCRVGSLQLGDQIGSATPPPHKCNQRIVWPGGRRRRPRDCHGTKPRVPDEVGRSLVHRITHEERCRGVVTLQSKAACRAEEINRLRGAGADGVILGCTEIGLLIQPGDLDLPVFDTTLIHAKQALGFALGPANGCSITIKD
jgi:hypothetical protein